MRILVIIISRDLNTSLRDNIQILKDSFGNEHQVDYAGVLSQDDFKNYEDIITFKFKMLSPEQQESKLRDFIEAYRSELNYDWYVRIRPEVKLLEPLDFSKYMEKAMNARVRVYVGPKRIQYGCSVGDPNGEWPALSFYRGSYSDVEGEIILDNTMYIFDNSLINSGFYSQTEPYPPEKQDEHYFTRFLHTRNIHLNPVGINIIFTRANGGLQTKSGHVNM